MNCNAAGCKPGTVRRDFELSEKLVVGGLSEEGTFYRTGTGEDPKDSPRSRHKPTVTQSCRRSTAMMHQQSVVYTVEVETDQSQPEVLKVSEMRQDVTHLQESDNANENQFQEVGRCVARQLQHSNLHASGSSLDKVAPQRCARKSRPEDKQVA